MPGWTSRGRITRKSSGGFAAAGCNVMQGVHAMLRPEMEWRPAAAKTEKLLNEGMTVNCKKDDKQRNEMEHP